MADSHTNTRKVVLAVDSSEHSERAFYWYIKNICNKETDNVMLIHVQEYPIIPPAPYLYYDDSSMYYDVYLKEAGKSNRETKKLLEDFAAKCKLHEVKFKVYKEDCNNPGEVICKLAKDLNAQLIVLGSRGVGTLRRTFLGSVSNYCVHHAHIPVVVVPPVEQADSS